jgi:hypothetical protein
MDNSHSGRLPAELRNETYKEVLVDSDNILIRLHDKRTGAVFARVDGDELPAPIDSIGLLQTCKEIHNEATPIFYGANCFAFDTELLTPEELYVAAEGGDRSLRRRKDVDAQCEVLEEWLGKRGQNASLLREVQVDLGTWRIYNSLLSAPDVHGVMQSFTGVLTAGTNISVTCSMAGQWRPANYQEERQLGDECYPSLTLGALEKAKRVVDTGCARAMEAVRQEDRWRRSCRALARATQTILNLIELMEQDEEAEEEEKEKEEEGGDVENGNDEDKGKQYTEKDE